MLRCFTTLTLQVIATLTFAQKISLTTYTSKDGLIDDHITAITQDHRQLLWVGTRFGIQWFDGTAFYEPPIQASPGQLYVTGFYKDIAGTIWTLSFYNGIYKFQNDKFSHFLPQPAQLTSNRNNVFCMMQYDSARYLVGTDQNIFWFDGSAFSPFDTLNPSLNTQIKSLATRIDNSVLIGTDKALWQYELENKKIKTSRLLLHDHKIFFIKPFPDYTWIATDRGLYRYDNTNPLHLQVPKLYLAGKSIFSVSGSQHRLWITGERMYLLQDGKVTPYDQSDELPFRSAGVYQSSEGLTWFISPKGLTRLSDNHYQAIDINSVSGNPMIICMQKKGSNELWLGSYGGLTKLFNGAATIIDEYKGERLGYVSWIEKTNNDQLLAGMHAGIMQITDNGLHKKHNLITTKVFEDSLGNLWLGTVEGRVYKKSGTSLTEIEMIDGVPDFIDAIFLDKQHFLWIGYRNNGIIKFRQKGKLFEAVKKFNHTNGFPDLRIRCGLEDNLGNIFFGTRTNGMYIFSAANGSIRHLNFNSGLAGNWVKSISIDKKNNIYAATNRGISVVKIKNDTPYIKRLQLSGGKAGVSANCVLAEEDSVWIGTDSGLLLYRPDKEKQNTQSVSVYLTEFTINGNVDTSFLPYTLQSPSYTLSHTHNIITFRFKGVDFQDQDLHYSYILVGQDVKWSQPDRRNFVSYNLPPGKYAFKVRAINNSGLHSTYPATLSFTILSPFWRTTWFFLAVIMAFIATIYFIYRYRVAQVIKLERMQGRISADLHDDLGSGLSRIKFLSETIKLDKKHDKELENKLDKISTYSDEMSEKIGEIVWALNKKNDKLDELIAYIRSYSMEYLTNHHITCQAVTPTEIPTVLIDGETRRNILLSVKEILFNIVKHAQATEVELGIHCGENLKIVIQDNGVGIDFDNIRPFSNGLTNIRERMQNCHGKVSFLKEGGTKIILIIPLDT